MMTGVPGRLWKMQIHIFGLHRSGRKVHKKGITFDAFFAELAEGAMLQIGGWEIMSNCHAFGDPVKWWFIVAFATNFKSFQRFLSRVSGTEKEFENRAMQLRHTLPPNWKLLAEPLINPNTSCLGRAGEYINHDALCQRPKLVFRPRTESILVCNGVSFKPNQRHAISVRHDADTLAKVFWVWTWACLRSMRSWSAARWRQEMHRNENSLRRMAFFNLLHTEYQKRQER